MKLTIFGSRSLSGDKVKEIIKSCIDKHNPEVILTAGETNGVCGEARQFAIENGIQLKTEMLDYKKNGKGAPDQRSRKILSQSDHVIFIYDGVSKGTRHEISLSVQMNIPYSLFVLSTSSTVAESISRDILFNVFTWDAITNWKET